MSDPIHSSDWTGAQASREPTYGAGMSSVSSDYERILRAQPAPVKLSPELRRWVRLVGLLFLSPLLLLGAWYFAHAATGDTMWADRREWLIYWSTGLVALFVRECWAGKPADPAKRTGLLAFALAATAGFAVWYCYAAITSYAGARPSQPVRAYEFIRSCGRNCSYYVHQRADGRTVEGIWAGRPVPYGSTCTLAQRLDGDYGFSWIRVLDRSPPPQHELSWPIRREDCFSDKPLSSLPR